MNETAQVLIDAICDNPSDTTPLNALADLLVGNGHPAGEVLATAIASPIFREFKGWHGDTGLTKQLKHAECGTVINGTLKLCGQKGKTKGRNAIHITVTRAVFAAESIYSENLIPIVQILVVPRQKKGEVYGYTQAFRSPMTEASVSLIQEFEPEFGCYWLPQKGSS